MIGAEREGESHATRVRFAAENDDGNFFQLRVFRPQLQKLEAVVLGHIEVEEDQVGKALFHQCECLDDAACVHHRRARAGEHALE